MPGILDHILVVLITVLLPIHDLLFWYPRVLRAEPGRVARARRHAYLESIGVQWSLVAATLGLWLHAHRPWEDLGFGLPGGWGFWLGLGIGLLIITAGTWQRLSLSQHTEEEVRQAVMKQIDHLRPLLPHTRREMADFTLVSLTAGICEEVLFRGFLIWYLSSLIPVVPALLVGSLLFGMAHAYQGVRGVLQTGLVGLGLVLLYVLTGTLWVPMAVHAFVDLNSGLLAYAYLNREREAL